MTSDQTEKGAIGNLLGHVEDSKLDLPEYEMDNGKCGLAIIINNTSNNDASGMYGLFHELGVSQIVEKNNLSAFEMKKELEEVAETRSKDKNYFVCVILSYGANGYIFGEEDEKDKVAVDDLIGKFKGSRCGELAGKPKLFFIQTHSLGSTKVHNDGPPEKKESESDEEKRTLPVEADFLLVHSSSSIPGSDTGASCSLFIDKLIKAVTTYKKSQDVLSILTRMNKEIAHVFHDRKLEGRKLPYLSSTLTKRLFFRKL